MKHSTSIVLTVLVALLALLWLAGLAGASRTPEPLAPAAGAPTLVSYQGQVAVNGTPYTGAGYFKFAIVNQAGSTTYWSNDDSSGGGAEPDKPVSLVVSSGLFNVLLGDTSLDNMTALPASAFGGTDRWLRVWFSSDDSTFVQLSPDRRIAAAPYALQAEEANNADMLDGSHANAFAASEHTHATLTAGTGLSGGSYNGGAAATLAVTYGTAAGSAVQGNETATITAGTGLSGGISGDVLGDGFTATLNVAGGSGITANADSLALGPLTANWSQTGAFDIVLGNAASELRIMESAGATYYGTLDVGDLSANQTYNFTTGGTVWTSGNDGSGSTLDADLLDGLPSSKFQQKYGNVVVVAQSGGDFTSIGAALTSIIDASATNHYLVWVAPGVYTETVTMKQYVDIEGAGELLTTISSAGAANTVAGANDAELRFLTVRNTGGVSSVCAISNSSVSPRLTHVTAAASGGTHNIGVYNYASSSPAMTNVTASASGDSNNYGVYNYASSSPTMTNVTASASGGANNNYGVYSHSSSPTMNNVTASASGDGPSYGVYNNYCSFSTMMNVTASASGGADNYGVYNASSSLTMNYVTATAYGGAASYGVYNADSGPTMNYVTATADGNTIRYGVYNAASWPTIQNSTISGNYGIYNSATSGSYTVKVNNCRVKGSTTTIANDTEFTVRIGASQLDGGAVINVGTVTCAGVYDEDYLFSASTCP